MVQSLPLLLPGSPHLPLPAQSQTTPPLQLLVRLGLMLPPRLLPQRRVHVNEQALHVVAEAVHSPAPQSN
jgi:hypothetical protein